jgi:succinoglycan biosynthesis transport protein ExoP
MDIRNYLRLVRRHWLLILLSLAVCTAGAAWYGSTREPVYAADTELFVSTKAGTAGQNPSETYQGGLFSQSRVESYARIASSLDVAEAVRADLGLSENARDVQSKITATVPEGTVLIDVTVKDESPEEAKAIADGVAEQLPRLVDEVEAQTGESPVTVSVTEPALLPTDPVSTSTTVYVILGLVLGLFLGIGAAVLRESVDKRIRYDDDAEGIVDAPIVGRIPRDSGARRRPLVVVAEPDSLAAEAYRRLRTNLRVLTIDRDMRSLLVTSAMPSEGKTLVAANLGFAFAQAGHKVVLVDGDMRRFGLTGLLGLDVSPGLSEALSGDGALKPSLHRESDLPLEVLTSGAPPPNPNELLDSDRFADLLATLTEAADIVVVDSPALLPVADGAVIARLTSAVALVARTSTRVDQFDTAAEFLRAVGKQPIGTILNSVRARGQAYGYGRYEAPETVPQAPA